MAQLLSFVLLFSCRFEVIGKNAFYGCGALESIIITSNVMNIEANAFTGCENLTISFADSSTWMYAESEDADTWTEITAEVLNGKTLSEFMKASTSASYYFKKKVD